MNTILCPSRPDERGSALVEGLIISSALLVFMTGIPMMASLVDLKQTAIQASRYVAWEKTIHKATLPIGDQVDARFFMSETSPIRTTEPDKNILGTNAWWGGFNHASPQNTLKIKNTSKGVSEIATENLPLYQQARVTAATDEVRVYIADPSLPGSATMTNGTPSLAIPVAVEGNIYPGVSKAAAGLGRFLSKDGWKDGEPYVNGLMRSQVEVKVQNNKLLNIASGKCSQGGAGCVHESTSILIDGWSAAEPKMIRDRVHGFVPSHRLEKVGRLVSKIKILPMLKDLKHLEKSFGCTKLGVRPSKDMRALPSYQPVEGDDC